MALFKVLRGIHCEGGMVYKKGDVVDSKSDLEKLNRPNSRKFGRVREGAKASPGIPINEVTKNEEKKRENERIEAELKQKERQQPGFEEDEDLIFEPEEQSDVATLEEEPNEEEIYEARFDAEELTQLKVSELEQLAAEHEIDISEVSKSPRLRKKQLIERLSAE